VHSYVRVPGDKTAYLSELSAGDEVVVVGPTGRQRAAVVGRVKIERRPLVLVVARTTDGAEHSILLQNAETVKVVGPSGCSDAAAGKQGWRAVSVSELRPGDEVLVVRQHAARHTGIRIEESIVER
jgi:3-dehydroquinate synthase class II